MTKTAQLIAEEFGKIPDVEAVSIAGSIAAGSADTRSDLDLFVYRHTTIPLPARSTIAQSRSDLVEIGNDFWEPGDAWIERDGGLLVEITYRTPQWIEDQLDRVLQRYEASLGYTTCVWHSVKTSNPVFDRNGWYQKLLERAKSSYPEPLRDAIIQKNHAVLRKLSSSYFHQIELAVARNDLVSLNHRVAAMLASYFDILFALNQIPHPGEKRLLQFAREQCSLLPNGMEEDIRKVLQLNPATLLTSITHLLDALDTLIRKEE